MRPNRPGPHQNHGAWLSTSGKSQTVRLTLASGDLSAPEARPWTCASSCLRLPISGLSPTPSFHAVAPAGQTPARRPHHPSSYLIPGSSAGGNWSHSLAWVRPPPDPLHTPGLPACLSGQPFLQLRPQNLPGPPHPVLPLTLLPWLLSLPGTLSAS